ncbi:MAG: P-II family nitrogen regulator [Balneolaceae bacterium]
MIKKIDERYKLIVFIVGKGRSREVLRACKKAGAEGGTVLRGTGTGIHNTGSFLGIKFEPEKDVILCLSTDKFVDKLLDRVTAAAGLDEPGRGIAFVLDSPSVTGISHLLKRDFEQ